MSAPQPTAKRVSRQWWLQAALAVVVLATTGWGHRIFVERIEAALGEMVQPTRPLSSLPEELGGWSGNAVALDPRVFDAVTFDDEYVNRVYVDQRTGRTLSLFVGYVGRPRAVMGHRPDVCFAAHGWEQTNEELLQIETWDGRPVPSILYEFRKPKDLSRRMLVLATYMINGAYSQDPDAFRDFNARSANLLGERPAYLARVQVALVAGADRRADLQLLEEFTALVADATARIMPYWEEDTDASDG
jgi:hypothetical protein